MAAYGMSPSGRRRGGRFLKLRLNPDEGFAGKGVKVSVRPECFTGRIEDFDWPNRKKYDEFDYGYVLTVHKAQGSQWDDVVLFDESFRVFPTIASAGSTPGSRGRRSG